MGRVFESLVGAQLLRSAQNIYYWSEGDFEVDYVYTSGKRVIAIEVKSGRNKKAASLAQFREKHPKSEVVFITRENYRDFESDPIRFIETHSI